MSRMAAPALKESADKDTLRHQVVQFLLQENYVITAFELLQELLEDGQIGAPAELLQQYFADETKFPAAEMLKLQTLESLDLQKVSDAKEAAEEAAAISQYELRIAREDIKSLQESLERHKEESSSAAEQGLGPVTPRTPQRPQGHHKIFSASLDSLSSTEKRDLNSAVQEYLKAQGYKLTAMTFCDEVSDQDLDDWPAGPGHVPDALHAYYSHFIATGAEDFAELKAENGRLTAAAEEARKSAESQAQQLQRVKDAAEGSQRELVGLKAQLASLKQDLEKERIRARAAEQKTAAAGSDARMAGPTESVGAESERSGEPNGVSPSGRSEEAGLPADGSGIRAEGGPLTGTSGDSHANGPTTALNGEGADDGRGSENGFAKPGTSGPDLETVKTVADSLPRIVPNVLINKREELLPLFIVAIEKSPDSETRESLTHSLFNLIKKPDDAQRKMIMDACVQLAQKIGETRTEEELLPCCWEQISHKTPERRLLVASSCGQLARYVRPEMRTSLILSIVQQLVDDSAPSVREAVVQNLAKLLPLFSDHEKYPKVEELALRLLLDPEAEVVEKAFTELLPGFLAWAKAGDRLMAKLLPTVLARALSTVQRCTPASGVADSAEAQLRILGERQRWNLDTLLRLLRTHLLPEVRVAVVRGCPFPCSKALADEGGEADGAEPEHVFSDVRLLEFAKSNQAWPTFDWLVNDCLMWLIQLACMIQPREEGLRRALSGLLLSINELFGKFFLQVVVLPIFLTAAGNEADLSGLSSSAQERIQALKPSTPSSEKLARMCVVPMLLAGVLGAPNMREGALADYVREVVLQTSLKDGAWSQSHTPELIDALRFLCTFEAQQSVVLGVLWELVVNPSALVKVSAAVIFKAMVPYVDLDNVTRQVLPALVTLGSDPNVEVKHASIDAFGAVAQNFKDDGIVDKIRVQMDSFLDDGSHEAALAVIKTLSKAAPLMAPPLREYLVGKVLLLANANAQSSSSITKRGAMAEVLYDALCLLNGCELSPATVRESFLPAIQALLKDPEILEGAQKEGLEGMVRERSGTTIQTALSMLGGMHLRKASMERVFDNVMGKKETGVVPITPPPAAAPVTPSPEKPPPEEGRIKKMMRLKYEEVMRQRTKSTGAESPGADSPSRK